MHITLARVGQDDLHSLALNQTPAGINALAGALPPAFVAARALGQLAAGKPAHWCSTFYVVDGAGNVVGGCGFKDAPEGGEVEIGYAIAPACRQGGIGTSAVQQLLTIAATSAVHTVVADIDPANLPSTRLVQKLGFTATGKFTDANGDELVRWRWHTSPAEIPPAAMAQ